MTSVLGCAPKPTMLRTSSGSLYWAKERSEAKYGTGMMACNHTKCSSASPRELMTQQGSTMPQDAGIRTGYIPDLLRLEPAQKGSSEVRSASTCRM